MITLPILCHKKLQTALLLLAIAIAIYIIITSFASLPTRNYFHSHLPNLKSTYSYYVGINYRSYQGNVKDLSLFNSEYSNFLRTKKYNSSLNTKTKWPPMSSKFYIPLAAVEMKGVSPQDAYKFLKLHHYNPEQIQRSKKKIVFDDLLKPTQHPDGLKFVLVEGAPGIGKSTLAEEICQRWSTNPTADNHLKQFSLVILVKLRDIQHATTLYDLLPKDPNTNMKEIEQQLYKTYGQNILWILDGFDELPCYQRQEGSFYRRLIEGNILEQSTVLVTSRPTATGTLVHFFERNKNRAK